MSLQVLDDRRARRRLKLGIGLFVLALAIPSALLVLKAYDQMKWESFRAQQLVAEELAARIDERLAAMARVEEARPIDDYSFLRASSPAAANRSPLANLHGANLHGANLHGADFDGSERIPGLIGYFEVAADGGFSSPLLPRTLARAAELGLDPAELAQRQARADRIRQVLIGNRLVERAEPEAPEALAEASPDERLRMSQAAFARLKTQGADAGAEALKRDDKAPVMLPQLDDSLAKRSRREQKAEEAKRAPELETQSRAEQGAGFFAGQERALPEVTDESPRTAPAPASAAAARVQLFQRTLGPIEVGLLDSGHLLLFRTVRRGAESLIQGALIEQAPFLRAMVAEPLAGTVLARSTHLSLAYRGELLRGFRAEAPRGSRLGVRSGGGYAEPLSGALLYRTRLREPFGGFELIFSVSHLPTPPGAVVIGWTASALALVLLVGAGLMYRLGARQLALLRQQQDFVSAVSHELKTPLTSIRLYAEMLSAGLAPEERKGTYYRFIHEESERLSRLINNVLQLARIGRGRLVLQPRSLALGELLAMVRERVAYQVERAGFALHIGCREDREIVVDPDAGVQILLNLIDNALKFGSKAALRQIDIDCESAAPNRLCIRVRDYGPGIPREQRKRVFELFYRGEQARHAAVAGTGIGLALVWRLTQAMQGQVEVIERDPGVEFRLELPLVDTRAP